MKDNISSLMDGEFHPGEASELIERVGRDEDARETWATYHLIGDVLRGDGGHQSGIQSRIFAKLAEEPTVLAPKPKKRGVVRAAQWSAAAAASVAAASVVIWMAAPDSRTSFQATQNSTTTELASVRVEAVSPSSGIQPVNFNEYLLAHEEFLPSTAGFRRYASMETVAPASGAAGR